jgi:hypothetical protein
MSGQRPSGGKPSGNRSRGAGRQPGGKPAAGRSAGAQRDARARSQGAKKPVSHPVPVKKRFSPTSLVAFGSIGLVVVVIVVLVLVKVTSSSKPSSALHAPAVTPAQPAVLAEIDAVTPAEAATVGEPSSVQPPHYDGGQPALTASGGKPVVLYIGGEFCPLCAAERWALIMALSRFGTFSNLHETTSSPWDSDPSTPTFTFYGSRYTSPHLELQAVENETNDKTGLGTRTTLQPVTTEQGALWQKYEAQYGESEGFPFLDIDNKVLIVSASYDPGLLAGLDQVQVASRLSNPQDPITQAIVGTANYLTAGICSATGVSASPWCTSAGVTSAAKALGLP